VLDAEVVGMIRRILGDVNTGRDEMMVEMIERVGIGGDFLKEKETARRLRAGEHFTARISSRQAYDQWAADGRDEVARARERMDALFTARAERGRPLDDAARAELAAICGVTPGMARALGG